MQKYMISFFLLLVMNGTARSMQKTAMRLYGDQKYFIRSLSHSFTSTYYAECTNKSDNRPSTFIISALAIKIKILEHQKKELEDKGFNDLQDQATIIRWHEVESCAKSIEKNKDLLRKHLDDLWKSKGTVNE